jgi:hypothetical protein
MEKKFKLKFELVPDGCWYSNLRTILSKKQWDFIRQDAKERSGGTCAICGRKPKRLEAHERWSYDEENCVQKLEDVVSLCPACHKTVHIGRSQLMGDGEFCENWFMKVNNCSYAEMRAELGKANEEHVRRNKISEWRLDLTYLKRYIKE